jgi:hypothetical protein
VAGHNLVAKIRYFPPARIEVLHSQPNGTLASVIPDVPCVHVNMPSARLLEVVGGSPGQRFPSRGTDEARG